jgi:O-antigen/teichoic acid export membrane protein
LFLVNYVPIEVIGELGIYLGIINWLFTIADAYALQGIIRFAGDSDQNRQINTISQNFYIRVLAGGAALYIIYAVLAYAGLYRFEELSLYIPMILIANAPRIYAIKIFQRELQYMHITICNILLYGIFLGLIVYQLFISGTPVIFGDIIRDFLLATTISAIYCIIFAYSNAKRAVCNDSEFYRKYSVPVIGQSLLNVSVRQLDIVLLGILAPLSVAGVYDLAKKVFKFFEEAGMAAAALFNPAIIRQNNKKDIEGVKVLIEKVYAYMLSMFIAVSLLVWSGGLEKIMKIVFDNPYIIEAMDVLMVLTIGGLFLPLFVLSFIFNAESKEKQLLTYNLIASVASTAIFLVFGLSGNYILYAFGLVTYYAIIGLFTYRYLKARHGFRLGSITRVFRDLKGFISNA